MLAEFGLIGYPLEHSFSANYFNDKFKKEGLTEFHYNLFAIPDILKVRDLILYHPHLKGLNVTIPFKKEIIKYIDEISPIASKIGAVNCININQGIWTGYNTDGPAFKLSLENWLLELNMFNVKDALVFGNGGASKAIQWALNELNIDFQLVTREDNDNNYKYSDINIKILGDFQLLINTTPVGMYPNINEILPIDLNGIKRELLLYDLIYNPPNSLFLKAGINKGCQVKNGIEMLHLQAELSWDIWNEK